MHPLGVGLLVGVLLGNTGVAVNSTLWFCSDRDGDHEIYTMDADGSNLQKVTDNTSDEYHVALSPDGSRLVFVSDRDGDNEIYVMNVDGSGLIRLTNDPADDLGPDWSPCGTKIVFMSDRDGDREIFVMNRDGSGVEQLTHNTGVDGFPSWSPDGTRIVFNSDLGSTVDIWAMDADGGGLQILTAGIGPNYMPDWSPDGSKIAFESTRHGPLELYTMDPDGSDVQRLTYTGTDNHEPDWSPDGSQIAFVSLVGGSYEVATINADGTGFESLTSEASMDWSPSWRLTVPPYLGRNPPGQTPVRFPPDSLLATDSLFWHGSPVFSPAMHEMHWASYVIHPGDQGVELFSMGVDMGHWTTPQSPPFADPSYGENNPFFSPSGDTLYFVSGRPGGFIFRTFRTPTGWSEVEPLAIPLPADAATGWQFSMADNGNVYFEIWSNYGADPPDIYVSRFVGGTYQFPENLSELNTTYNDFSPYVHPEEEYVIFTSNRPGGLGFHDLYISFRDDGSWTTPVNMGTRINTGFEDAAPSVSRDGLYFFFQTQKAGDLGYNPYWVSTEIIDSIQVAVPTQLASYSARPTRDGVEISWRLSELEPGSAFHIFRSPAARSNFRELENAVIERNGLAFRHVDTSVEPASTYRYLVEVTDETGPRVLFETEVIATPKSTLVLNQNHPNPFNPSTSISFSLPAKTVVNLSIFDVSGKLVRTLFAGTLERGYRVYEWNGTDATGTPVGSGVYFYRLAAGKRSMTKKMVLLK